MKKTSLKGLTLKELQEFALSIGEKKFRGAQLFDWLYAKEATDFSAMTSLPKALQGKLAACASIDSLTVVGTQESPLDGTRKLLLELTDGRRIESVLIPPRTAFKDSGADAEEEQKRLTLCVSTQVGCPLDCRFCATGQMGYARNLTSGEIVDQVLAAKKASGRRITNLVYMGMGEPLLNYDNVMKSIEIATDGLGIAARRITVSTAGWVPGILRMADENRKVKLAISLHSLDQSSREELMPVAKKYPLDALLDAARHYYRKVRRRVTFEYILFEGWNDREEDAKRLVALAKAVPSKLNIIPFHSIGPPSPAGLRLRPASAGSTEAFAGRLRRLNLDVFVRSSAGEDIAAACGQLAVRSLPQARRHRDFTREEHP